MPQSLTSIKHEESTKAQGQGFKNESYPDQIINRRMPDQRKWHAAASDAGDSISGSQDPVRHQDTSRWIRSLEPSVNAHSTVSSVVSGHQSETMSVMTDFVTPSTDDSETLHSFDMNAPRERILTPPSTAAGTLTSPGIDHSSPPPYESVPGAFPSDDSIDIFVAVMGATGSGKSTFISLCCDQEIEIGHGLQSCTRDIAVYSCKYNANTTIHLVDTPGFNDTTKSDTEVLRDITSWLNVTYRNNLKFHGIVFLHSIEDRRLPGSGVRNLSMLKKVCGPGALGHVLLTSTRWDIVPPQTAVERENQLTQTNDFWGWMIAKGAKVERHDNTRESAMRLLAKLVSSTEVVLDIQTQMVDQGKGLDQTTAGTELASELAQAKVRQQDEIAAVRREMQEALQAQDRETAEALHEAEERSREKIAQIDIETRLLQADMAADYERRFHQLESVWQQRQQEAESKYAKQIDELQKALKAMKKDGNDNDNAVAAGSSSDDRHRTRFNAHSSNCLGSTGCKSCSNCAWCKDCTNCSNCLRCTNCVNCSNCFNCVDCVGLTNAVGQVGVRA